MVMIVIILFGSFVVLMTMMDCFQPKVDDLPKNHCWHCRKKGTTVLTEGTPEYEAFMKKRAGKASLGLGHEASNHFHIHDSDDENDHAGELKNLLGGETAPSSGPDSEH